MTIDFKKYTKKEFIALIEDVEYGMNAGDKENNPLNYAMCPEAIGLSEFQNNKCFYNIDVCKACWLESIKDVEFKAEK
jgi:hypothetical protein